MKRSPLIVVTSIGFVAFALACEPQEPAAVPIAPLTSAPPAKPQEHVTLGEGPDEKAIDSAVSPCNDFYTYACGGWNRATPIPDDQTSWMRSFSVIREENEKLLRAVLEEYSKGASSDAHAKSLGDFYAACTDEATIEKAGAKPLEADLKAISSVKTRADLMKLLARFHAAGIRPFFEFGSQQDFKDATLVIGSFDQVVGPDSSSISSGGLGLPEREYYLKDEPRMKEIRGKYIDHIAKMLELSGLSPAASKAAAQGVMSIETELAKISMTKEDLRDPEKIYHRLERVGLKEAAPSLDWDGYLADLSLPTVSTLNVSQPEYFHTLGMMLEGLPQGALPAAAKGEAKTKVEPKVKGDGKGDDKAKGEKPKGDDKAKTKGDKKGDGKADGKGDDKAKGPKPVAVPKFKLADIQSYLRFHLVRTLAGKLPARFVDEAFNFRRELTGAKSLPPRWKRCVRATDGALGEVLAESFVKRTLGEEGKKTTLGMIHEIEATMKSNLGKLSWMDEATRTKAEEKLSLIGNKIGYPDKWRDYSALEKVVQKDTYLANFLAANTFESKRQLAKIGKPLDRTEWYMTPPTVNAYYDSQMNEMVFPAGILQPPFYANKTSLAVNFGGIGMVMGHELTHGFDDEGRKFDAHGNLTEWWSPSVGAEFVKRASCVEEQFSGYVAIGDQKVNGKLTLGENIADLGGIKLAYGAMKHRLDGKIVDGAGKFTPSQQFFLGYAQAWCGNYRDKAMEVLVNTNPHSPPKFRVNGPLSNMPEFAEAFSCKPSDAMVRKNRCEIW